MNVNSTIEMNNAAISCICQGQLNEARTLLLRSIRLMKSQLSEEADAPTKSLACHDDLDSTGDDSCLQSVSVLRLSSDQGFQQRNFDSSSLSFFDRVYRIKAGSCDNHELICAAIIYNTAMVMHLTCLPGETCLCEKVEQLYHMCDVTLQDCKFASSDAYLLSLAALNNTAHINSMLLRAHETGRALDDLVSKMALLDREVSIEKDDLLIFQMNAFLHSIKHGFRTAPSA